MTNVARKLLPCPKCNTEVEDLLKIDTGMRLALENSGHKESVVQVCPKCYTEMSTLVSQGARLRAQKNHSDFNKKILWKNRVDFLKQARNLMSIRAYPESALMYEKYIKSVAIGFDVKPSDLKPELFKDPRFRKEYTVISYVLWDLYKIYDGNDKYKDRQILIANKLRAFAMSNSSIQGDIARKLLNFAKSARNKALTTSLLKDIDKTIVRCFIATAAFESGESIEVQTLCKFRDQVLRKYFLGNVFIKSYYFISPRIAQFLDHSAVLKKLTRYILRIIATRLNELFELK